MDRQLAKGPSVAKNEELCWGGNSGMGKEGKPGKGLASCNYGASATPTLSPIIRVRFEVRFSGPLRAKRRARATARHRDPNVHVNPWRNRRQRAAGAYSVERDFSVCVCMYRLIYYMASGVRHKSIRHVFGFLGCVCFLANCTTARHATDSPWRVDAWLFPWPQVGYHWCNHGGRRSSGNESQERTVRHKFSPFKCWIRPVYLNTFGYLWNFRLTIN